MDDIFDSDEEEYEFPSGDLDIFDNLESTRVGNSHNRVTEKDHLSTTLVDVKEQFDKDVAEGKSSVPEKYKKYEYQTAIGSIIKVQLDNPYLDTYSVRQILLEMGCGGQVATIQLVSSVLRTYNHIMLDEIHKK